MTNVSPLIAADASAAMAHLEMLFGRSLNGMVEMTLIHTDQGSGRRIDTRFFDVGDLEEAATWALEGNRVDGWNAYVGASLRIDDVFPGKAATDADFLKSYALFADADTAEQLEKARAGYRAVGMLPPFIVVTGTKPEMRAQMWWPLEEPITSLEEQRSALRGVAQALGTDPAVCTGKQLMRLAGSRGWPKSNKPGRALEQVTIKQPATAQRVFTLEQVVRAFPSVAMPLSSAGDAALPTVAPSGSLGLLEQIEDGRERYAWRLIRANLKDFIGETGAAPTAQELFEIVWPVYSAKVSQKRGGRGPAFVLQKCGQCVTDFHRGIIPGARSLDEAVESYLAKGARTTLEAVAALPEDDADGPGDTFELLSLSDIKTLPDAAWLIEDTIPHNGLGFIYGEPGCGKSFIALDLGLTLAYGGTEWLGKPVSRVGGVLYLAAEGSSGMKTRVEAWQRARGLTADDVPFHLIRQPMSFMDEADTGRLERTVEQLVARTGPVSVVFVDTVSRVLPGSDENLQKEMTLFIGACDRIRALSGATVIGVHHPSKAGGMRGSTVFLGAGDCVFKVEKPTAEDPGRITCEKQKEAQDGWIRTFELEPQEWIPQGSIKGVSSLTVKFKTDAQPAKVADQWPERRVLGAIVRAVQEAWDKGRPWSPHAQTRKEGRYAPRNISAGFRVSASIAQEMVEEWQRTGLLRLETYDTHTKKQGLRVAEWPIWARGGSAEVADLDG